MSWARALREHDPAAARWVMGAFATLQDAGAGLPLLAGARQSAQRLAAARRRDLVVYCQVQPWRSVTYVERCELASTPGEVTSVVFRCARPVTANMPRRALARTVPSAARLLSAAARLLGPAHQGRYAEEFRAELAAISRAGASRRAQLAYSCRTLAYAPRLRRELDAHAPRRGHRNPEEVRQPAPSILTRAISCSAPLVLLWTAGLLAILLLRQSPLQATTEAIPLAVMSLARALKASPDKAEQVVRGVIDHRRRKGPRSR